MRRTGVSGDLVANDLIVGIRRRNSLAVDILSTIKLLHHSIDIPTQSVLPH